MSYNPELHKRQSTRLKDYDYSSSGIYFITICLNNRECLFGEIVNQEINLSDIGKIAHANWLNIPEHFKNIELDEFIIMPNHLHGILIVKEEDVKYYVPTDTINYEKQRLNSNDNVSRDVLLHLQNTNSYLKQQQNSINQEHKNEYFSKLSPVKNTISVIIRTYKSSITSWCRKNDYDDFKWQKNYHDHIIRSESSLNSIRKYILENPLKWENDSENPQRKNKK